MQSDRRSKEFTMRSDRLWERVQANQDAFTRSELLIAEGLRTQAIEIPFSSASTVSAKIGVSEATLIRFARTIGYDSYQDLQQDLQDEVRQRLNITTLDRWREHPAGGSEHLVLVQESLRRDIANLGTTLEGIDAATVDAAVATLTAARRLYVVGTRASMGPAQLAAQMLQYALEDVRSLTTAFDTHLDELIDARQDDAILAVSLARASRRTLEIATFAKERKIPVVAICDSPLSPIARLADVSFIVESESNTYVQSYTAAIAVVTALITAVGAACRERTEQRLAKVEDLMARFHLHVKAPNGKDGARA
jgi:DNA-binding MurR/RpiR family transcriptional regulator